MSKEIVLEGTMMDKKIKTLKQLRIDGENWLIYYIDEVNGEKWVKEYPESFLHGGGLSQLKSLDKFPWEISK